MVGIYSAGDHRIDEYTPTGNEKGQGGALHLYARFLVEELKPYIDANYRTRAGPQDTGLGGSSPGALASVVVGLSFPHVYGKLALHSPSVWWGGRVALEQVRGLETKPGTRINAAGD